MPFTVDAIVTAPDRTTRGRRVGEYITYDEAVVAAQQLIDGFLFREYRRGAARGVTAEMLLALYRRVAEKPVILRQRETSTAVSRFDHIAYAKKRCVEICEAKSGK